MKPPADPSIDRAALAVDLGEQRPPPADFLGGQTDGERQVVDPKSRTVGVLLDVPWVKLGPEHARVLAAKAVAVVQVGRQMDAAGNPVLARVNKVESRRKAGPVGPRGHVGRAWRQHVDAGQHHVRRMLVTGQAMRHRSDDRELVRPGRQARQMLAVGDAGRRVAIGLNSPRISTGAWGFRSNVSRWLGAPVKKINTTDLRCPAARPLFPPPPAGPE